MKTKTILGICLSLCVWSFAGCGDDETIDIFPEGTASLRMMNEELGNSDVYITNAGNFKSDQFPLFDVGEKRGIGDIDLPGFTNMAPEVAVQPRHGYVICTADDVRSFPSGQQAICENANIYRACSSILGLRTRRAKRLEPTSISCLANRRQTKEFLAGAAKSDGSMTLRKGIPLN